LGPRIRILHTRSDVAAARQVFILSIDNDDKQSGKAILYLDSPYKMVAEKEE